MTETFREVMRGHWPDEETIATHYGYRLDTRAGTISESRMLDDGWQSEFPSVDPCVSTRRNRRILMLTSQIRNDAEHPLFDSVTLFDVERGSMDRWRYPADCIPEEHLFVPGPGSAPESTGWLMGTFLDLTHGVTGLNVFDATAVASGPIVTARLPYPIPLGLHGRFVSA